MLITLYGIPNCGTVRKARAWLDARGVAHVFHDFRKQGVPATDLDLWLAACGWEALLNRSGTTWRLLDPARRASVVDVGSARALMQAQPSVIRRPVATWADGSTTVGFDPDDWQQRI